MKYIDCKQYAQEILDDVRKTTNKDGTFVIISVGNNPASQSYIKGKIKDCEYCGIQYEHINIDADKENAKETLLWSIVSAAVRDEVSSIILQLPLPDGWDEEYFLSRIPREKDVDGLRSNSTFLPCTPEGILYTIKKILGDNLSGKTALIIGRGKLVGRPLFDLLLKEDCTVTIAHSKTKNLAAMLYVDNYDIVVVAAGKPRLVNLQSCNKATKIIIDAGVNRVDGKLCGDCYNFDVSVSPKLLVSPVPKGIGLMTRAMLMQHIAKVNKKNQQ